MTVGSDYELWPTATHSHIPPTNGLMILAKEYNIFFGQDHHRPDGLPSQKLGGRYKEKSFNWLFEKKDF